MLTKDKVTAKPPRLVTLESTGERAYIRRMTGTERVRIFKDGVQINPELAVMYFLGNEDGTRMFSDDERASVENMDGILFQDIFLAGLEVNGLTDKSEDAEAKK